MECQILNKLAEAPKGKSKRVLYTDGNTGYKRCVDMQKRKLRVVSVSHKKKARGKSMLLSPKA